MITLKILTQFSRSATQTLVLGLAFPSYILNCDALRDLVPFVQFKKREKH